MYVNGRKSGQGKFVWANGTVYTGNFVEDQREGYGVCEWKSGASGEPGLKYYHGEWKEGRMHGKGKFEWFDGKVYTGDYSNDVKDGYGVM